MNEAQLAELERIREWACCFEPERRFMAEADNAELLEALVAITDRCCLNDRFPDLTGLAYEIIRKHKGEN